MSDIASSTTAPIALDSARPAFAVPFSHRRIGDSVMIANGLGDYLFLAPAEFARFVAGNGAPGDPLYERLAAANFVAAAIDVPAQATRYARRKGFLKYGPVLHGFVLTERCNHGCQYCHSSIVGMDRVDTDMSAEVAEAHVDFAFQTTSPWFTIEFQGGEPTIAWDRLVHIVRYAQGRNLDAKKELSFSLVTNFSLMTEERAAFLVDNRVQVCTSLDGPEDLHNQIRIYKGGNSFANTTFWIKRFNELYAERGLDTNLYRVEALPTITRASLTRAREIVDTYVSLGCRAVFLRKLDPFGFAAQTHKKLGYSIDEFIAFYREAFEYILELSLVHGVQVMERNAAIILTKMLHDDDPNYLDLRSPGGAAIGQLAYHPNGKVYSSDEGRMVAAMGDEVFCLGDTATDSYRDVMASPTVRALVLASTNDALPDCRDCVYKAWCGQQPEYNYVTQGSLFGRMRDSTWCRKHKQIFDYIAWRLRNADDAERELYRVWTTRRPQEHFLQDTE